MRAPFMRLTTLLFAAALGCAMGTERFGRPLLEEQIAQIQVGRSTRAEVLALLGPPVRDPHERDAENGVERAPNERALYWEYSERRERFATAILYTFFSQETLVDSLMVTFDDRGVVEVVAFERETRD